MPIVKLESGILVDCKHDFRDIDFGLYGSGSDLGFMTDATTVIALPARRGDPAICQKCFIEQNGQDGAKPKHKGKDVKALRENLLNTEEEYRRRSGNAKQR